MAPPPRGGSTAGTFHHYMDVIMGAMASQITSLTIVYWPVYPGADERKHQSSASLACLRGIHRWPVNSPHKGPVTREIFPFDDVIMMELYLRETRWTPSGKRHKWVWLSRDNLCQPILVTISDMPLLQNKNTEGIPLVNNYPQVCCLNAGTHTADPPSNMYIIP